MTERECNLDIVDLNVGPLETNCYLIGERETGRAIIIDPGAEGGRILNLIHERGWNLEKILLTHGHFDHIGAVAMLKQNTDAEIWIHKEDRSMLQMPDKNFSLFWGTPCICPEADGFLKEGMSIFLDDCKLEVLHTPGHSPGSVSFVGDSFVMVGDTLFRNSVGRTDIPGSSRTLLLESIKKKLLVLDERTRVYPGHGPVTSIADEKRGNPFLV
jgi:hydroxyacylglutathione hydrolase